MAKCRRWQRIEGGSEEKGAEWFQNLDERDVDGKRLGRLEVGKEDGDECSEVKIFIIGN